MPETTLPSFPPGKRETQTGASHPAPGNSLLFLREDELRTAQALSLIHISEPTRPY